MPRHQQITTCRRSGGPVSHFCTCEHCNLTICAVCGAYEGSLTTDCPGVQVDFSRQREAYETPLDYTDDRGWHQGELQDRRSPRFTTTRQAPKPPRSDPRVALAPALDWPTIDRYEALQYDLMIRAIAWVIADRSCDDLSDKLTHAQDEADAHLKTLNNLSDSNKKIRDPDIGDTGRVLLARLEGARSNFQEACSLSEERDDEFRQAARKLVDTLEAKQIK